MSKKGGYQIIDLRNKNFAGSVSFEFPGIYDSIEGTNKAILVSGLVVNGYLKHDEFASVVVAGSSYRLKVTNYTVVVSDTDVVSIEKD